MVNEAKAQDLPDWPGLADDVILRACPHSNKVIRVIDSLKAAEDRSTTSEAGTYFEAVCLWREY